MAGPGFGPGVMSCQGHVDWTAEGCVLSWLCGPQQGGAAHMPHVFMLPRLHGSIHTGSGPVLKEQDDTEGRVPSGR